jgi:hypothetical protein
MGYCRSCHIGTFDAEGLCVLCGASQTPPTRRTRLAEAGGAVLSALLSPAALLVCCLGVLLVALARFGHQLPAGAPRLPGAVAAGGASGVALGLIGTVILQSIVLLLVVIIVLLVLRRRRERPESLSVGEHRRALWS